MWPFRPNPPPTGSGIKRKNEKTPCQPSEVSDQEIEEATPDFSRRQPRTRPHSASREASWTAVVLYRFSRKRSHSFFSKKYFKTRGMIGRRKTPWTGDRTNLALVAWNRNP